MSSNRIGPGAGRLGGIGNIGHAAAGVAAAAVPSTSTVGSNLSQVRYASTWPRGWMAAAVAQHVREFNTQVSKAQMALAFVNDWSQALETLQKALHSLQKFPSQGAEQRAQQALLEVRQRWLGRYGQTLGSVDEQLHWSPVHAARKRFHLSGWRSSTLQSTQSADRELVSFCLMGQEGAHGAWLAEQGRADSASHYALAAALAPLHIQLQGVRAEMPEAALVLSVDERQWPVLLERFMVKGNGRRFPAGQWVSPALQTQADAFQPDSWTLESAGTPCSQALAAAALLRAQLQQFCDDAGQTLATADAQRLQQMQQFAQRFAQAGQMPVYEWVLAVVPAVRAIARRRVTRLLRSPGALG